MEAVASGIDELAWLKREFDLSREQLDRIRKLHEGYKPRCEEMCLRFSKKNSELVQALKRATHAPPDLELKLRELAVIRAE